MSREEKFEVWDRAFLEYTVLLWRAGKVRVA